MRGETEDMPVPTAGEDCRKRADHSQGPGHPPFLPAEGWQGAQGPPARDPGGQVRRTTEPSLAGSLNRVSDIIITLTSARGGG